VGLHNWDCPNLLWELMRTRRVKLTAQHLLTKNVAEAIVDKDNHARDPVSLTSRRCRFAWVASTVSDHRFDFVQTHAIYRSYRSTVDHSRRLQDC
jgi:hypothetical protein